mmetsp:Transcript_13098/g.19546  ORF Transcript_13098/g.19546 Transcript_13098/m.19546 type:complete len:145 (-) Transcript_13098:52-486(-)
MTLGDLNVFTVSILCHQQRPKDEANVEVPRQKEKGHSEMGRDNKNNVITHKNVGDGKMRNILQAISTEKKNRMMQERLLSQNNKYKCDGKEPVLTFSDISSTLSTAEVRMGQCNAADALDGIPVENGNVAWKPPKESHVDIVQR